MPNAVHVSTPITGTHDAEIRNAARTMAAPARPAAPATTGGRMATSVNAFCPVTGPRTAVSNGNPDRTAPTRASPSTGIARARHTYSIASHPSGYRNRFVT